MVEVNNLSHVDAITYESLRLILGDIMAPVVDLEIQESPNQHGKLSVTIIAEEPVKDYILYEGNNDIAVLYMQNGAMKALFQGILINMRVMAAGEVYYVLDNPTNNWLFPGYRNDVASNDKTYHESFPGQPDADFYPRPTSGDDCRYVSGNSLGFFKAVPIQIWSISICR